MVSQNAASWKESLSDLFASRSIVPRAASPGTQRAVVQVFGPVIEREEILIGTLSNEASEYVFRYDDHYASKASYPALVAFPDKQREYRSRELWPFFGVRVPPLDRVDIQHLISEKKLDTADKLRLLVELGRRTITTPYELRYSAASAG